MTEHRPTKLFLRIFVVSIAATAVIGIIAIAKPGEIGWFEVKVLLTTGTIAAASICGLSCAGCLTRGRTILPVAGLALTILAACLLILGTWTELEWELLLEACRVGIVFRSCVCPSIDAVPCQFGGGLPLGVPSGIPVDIWVLPRCWRLACILKCCLITRATYDSQVSFPCWSRRSRC